MTELDKFKRRLIRSVSRLLLEEKKSEEDVWEHLNKETRCDCKLLWERMRAITIKKIKRLLPADDRPNAIPTVARLTFTDWLLFDLVLVHENIDVIDRDRMQEVKGQWKSLMDLFALVQKYHVENLGGTRLAEGWSSIALAYNSSGRQCSPMMLQYRWYQLKELTRSNFYNLWVNYRGNNKLWDSAKQYTPSKLQMAIAKRYPHVVTQPFPKWEELIKTQKVILPEEFGMIKNNKETPKPDETDSDVIMLEPVIETIDLGRDSDSEETDQNQDDPSNEPSPSPTDDNDDDLVDVDLTKVKSEPEFDGLCNVQILDTTGSGEGNTISEDINKKLEQQSQLLTTKRNLALEMSQYIEATEELFTDNLDRPTESETIEDLCDSDTVDDEVTESTDELIQQKAYAFLSRKENEKVNEATGDLIQQKANAFLHRKENEEVNESTEDLIQQKANAFISRIENEEVIDTTDDLIQQRANKFLSRVANVEVNESTKEQTQQRANTFLRTKKAVNLIKLESIQDLCDDETIPVDDDAASSESTENDLKADSTEDLIEQKAKEFVTKTEKHLQNPVTEIDEDSDTVDDIIKQKAEDFIKKTDAKKPVEDSAVSLGLSSDDFMDEGIEFVDDGIEFVDDGIEYVDDEADDDTRGAGVDLQKPLKTETENAEEPQPAEEPSIEDDDSPKFDLKLLMEPVVYTVKLDNMKVFEGNTFHTVRDKDIIDSILVESKPVSKSSVVKAEPEHLEETNDDKITDVREENVDHFGSDIMSHVHEETSDNFGNEDNDIHEDADDNGDMSESSEEETISDDQKVKISSYLLQKPRSRNYNPIQLCKNPDFNTRLKRLTAGFFSSPRNCQLIKACKPMTIDLHKAFEDKLVNGTIYLKSDGKASQPIEEDNHSKQTTSVLPSAMPIQSLINNTVMDINELVGLAKTSTGDTVDLTNKSDAEKAERNKVINLRDITEIRRINQQLLTAEVTPIQVQNNDNINVPYKHQTIVTHICNEDDPTNLEPRATQSWNVPKQTAKRTSILIDKLPRDREKTATSKKKLGRPAIKTDKPAKKRTMPVYSQMTRGQVAWNKPLLGSSARNTFNDFLITIDTLNKMIVKLSGFDEYKPKKKKKYWVVDGSPNESTDVAEKIDKAKKVDTDAKKPKEPKKKRFCCWCNEKKEKMFSKQRVKQPHNCPLPVCHCCCRDQLIDALKEENIKLRSNVQIPSVDNMSESIESVVQQSVQTSVPTPLLRICNQNRDAAHDSTQPLQNTSNLASSCGQKTIVEAVLNTDLAQTLVVDSDNVDSNVGFINQPEANDADTIVSQEVVVNTDQNTFDSNQQQNMFDSQQPQIGSQQPQIDDLSQLRPVLRINITTDPPRKKMYVPVPGSSRIRNVATTSTETQTMPLLQSTEIEHAVKRRPTTVDNSAKILLDGSNSIPVPRTVVYENETSRNEKVIYLTNQHFSSNPVNSPICLGKNKILLTTVKLPRQFDHVPEGIQNPKVIPTLPLPQGVLLVMLPNGELSYTVEPGVQLDDAQIAALPNIIAAVKKQINPIPAQPVNPPSQDVIEIPGDDDNSPPSENTAEKSVEPANIILEERNEALVNTPDNNQTSAELTTNVTNVSLEAAVNCESFEPGLVSSEEQTLNETTEPADLNSSKESNEIIEIDECVQSVGENSIINANNEVEKSIESAGTSRKSLLSDLMEMSGISAEDTSTHEVAPVEPTSTIPITEPAIAVCTGTQSGIQNTEFSDSVKNMTGSIQAASDVVNLPELTPITSLAELKYACDNNGLFYKLDLETGLIVPINVCIKKKPKRNVFAEKTVIDLTDDFDNTTTPPLKLKAAPSLALGTTNLPKIAPKFMTLNKIIEQRKKHNIKPVKLFKAVHPTILKRKIVTITSNNANPIQVRQTFIKKKRKADKVDVRIDLVESDTPMEEEYLVNSSDSENDARIPDNVIHENICDEKNPADSDDSDDEPLAKKVKRQRILNENVDNNLRTNNPEESAITQDGPQPTIEEAEPMDVPGEPLENIDSVNAEGEPDIEPALDFMEYDSDVSQDDCILGF